MPPRTLPPDDRYPARAHAGRNHSIQSAPRSGRGPVAPVPSPRRSPGKPSRRAPGRRPAAGPRPPAGTPKLLRVTIVAGLIAAAGVSLVRAQPDTSLDSHLSLSSSGGTAPVGRGTPESPVESCRVTYTVTARSTGRFTAAIAVTNTGRSAVNGWTLRWRHTPAGPASRVRLSDAWNAAVSVDGKGGQVIDTDPGRPLAAGETATIGYEALVSGRVPEPSDVTLNGVKCR